MFKITISWIVIASEKVLLSCNLLAKVAVGQFNKPITFKVVVKLNQQITFKVTVVIMCCVRARLLWCFFFAGRRRGGLRKIFKPPLSAF